MLVPLPESYRPPTTTTILFKMKLNFKCGIMSKRDEMENKDKRKLPDGGSHKNAVTNGTEPAQNTRPKAQRKREDHAETETLVYQPSASRRHRPQKSPSPTGAQFRNYFDSLPSRGGFWLKATWGVVPPGTIHFSHFASSRHCHSGNLHLRWSLARPQSEDSRRRHNLL